MVNTISVVAYGSSEFLQCFVLPLLCSQSHNSIIVAEATQADEHSSDESLAASSVIMPPAPSLGAASGATRASAGMSIPTSSLTIPSAPPSDDGSFDSSISLINIPSSPSIDDDDEDYQDSRSRIATVPPSPAAIERDLEYVVLYETSTSESE